MQTHTHTHKTQRTGGGLYHKLIANDNYMIHNYTIHTSNNDLLN